MYSGSLLDNLDCAGGTLAFASSADQAFINFGRIGLAFFDLVDAYWAGVYAGFASVAFADIYYYFYHVHTSLFFD